RKGPFSVRHPHAGVGNTPTLAGCSGTCHTSGGHPASGDSACLRCSTQGWTKGNVSSALAGNVPGTMCVGCVFPSLPIRFFTPARPLFCLDEDRTRSSNVLRECRTVVLPPSVVVGRRENLS